MRGEPECYSITLPAERPEPGTGQPARPGFDLLRLGGVRRLVLWCGFPYVFQAALLVVFVALAVLGWRLAAPAGVPAKLHAKCSLVTLLIWGLWWPAMVWTAVLLGRAWCMVCPLELVSNLGERAGRRLGLPQCKLPRWVAAGWLIVALYALIQMLVAGVSLHRNPHYTAIFLWTLLGVAAVAGLLLKDRGFCRGFCPVGLLLGTYGRGGMLAVRPGGAEQCAACDERLCLRNCNRTKLDGRSCPSLLNPPKLNSNRDCLICGQCLKACRLDNMQLRLRLPFSRHDAREPRASWPVTLFVMVASGFVTLELCTGWPAAEQWFLAVPEWLSRHLHPAFGTGWVEGVWTLLLVPAGSWTALAVAAQAKGPRERIRDVWRRLALPLAVIVAAGHMSKGLSKFSSWAGYLPRALESPDGRAAAEAVRSGLLPVPRALLPPGLVAVAGCALVTVGLVLAVREARLAGGNRSVALTAPLLVMALLFGTIVAGWS